MTNLFAYSNGVREVHAARNQSEYPRISRWERLVQAWQRFAAELNWPGGITPIPYHKDNLDYGGVWLPAYNYPITPIVYEGGYGGEGFLIMQEQVLLPHPSGLPDDTPLATNEQWAEVMRSGVRA